MIDGGQVFKRTAAHFGCGLGGASSGLAQAGYQVTGYVFPGVDVADAQFDYPYEHRELRNSAKGPGPFGPSLRAVRRELAKGYDYDMVWVTVQNLADASEFVLLLQHKMKGAGRPLGVEPGLFHRRHWVVELRDTSHPEGLEDAVSFWRPLAELWAEPNGELRVEGVPPGILRDAIVSRRYPPAFLHVGGDEVRVMFSSLWELTSAGESKGVGLAIVDVGEEFEEQSRQMFAEEYAGGVLEQGDQCPWLSRDTAAGETHPGIARTLGLLARNQTEPTYFEFKTAE